MLLLRRVATRSIENRAPKKGTIVLLLYNQRHHSWLLGFAFFPLFTARSLGVHDSISFEPHSQLFRHVFCCVNIAQLAEYR